MRRGEVWRYSGLRERLVLIVSADALNEAGEITAVDVDVLTTEGPLSLLSVQLDETRHARCYRIGLLNAKNFVERAMVVPQPTMDQVDAALRNALDLM